MLLVIAKHCTKMVFTEPCKQIEQSTAWSQRIQSRTDTCATILSSGPMQSKSPNNSPSSSSASQGIDTRPKQMRILQVQTDRNPHTTDAGSLSCFIQNNVARTRPYCIQSGSINQGQCEGERNAQAGQLLARLSCDCKLNTSLLGMCLFDSRPYLVWTRIVRMLSA